MQCDAPLRLEKWIPVKTAIRGCSCSTTLLYSEVLTELSFFNVPSIKDKAHEETISYWIRTLFVSPDFNLRILTFVLDFLDLYFRIVTLMSDSAVQICPFAPCLDLKNINNAKQTDFNPIWQNKG